MEVDQVPMSLLDSEPDSIGVNLVASTVSMLITSQEDNSSVLVA